MKCQSLASLSIILSSKFITKEQINQIIKTLENKDSFMKYIMDSLKDV